MRELSRNEIEQVSGAGAAGQWLNDNTPIQSWIGSGIDALTGGGGGGGGRFPVYENLSD